MKFYKIIPILLILLSGCTPSVYWNVRKNTGLQRLDYKRPLWGTHAGCAGVYQRQPIKPHNWRKLGK